MRATISTHNGSTAHRDHNIRNRNVTRHEEHIDAERPHEIWLDEKPQEAYQRIFGEALQKYNDSQTREDRKINDYYKHICKDSKKHPVYEMIVGVYPEKGQRINEPIQREILKKFVDEWKERNPNLLVCGAYYHADEQGEPHVHIDYIPVAHNYAKGMEVQNGLVKALGEQGFEKRGKETAQIQWERRENKALEEICKEYGIEVIRPNRGLEHLTTDEYKQAKTSLEAEIDHLIAKRDKAELMFQKALERENKALEKTFKWNKKNEKIEMNKVTFEKLKELLEKRLKDVQTIIHSELDVLVKYDEVENMLKAQQEGLNKAKQEYQHLMELKQNMDNEIKEQAQLLANRQFQEFLKREFSQPDKNQRLVHFCENIAFNNGQTVMDKFREQELQEQTRLANEWERSQ